MSSNIQVQHKSTAVNFESAQLSSHDKPLFAQSSDDNSSTPNRSTAETTPEPATSTTSAGGAENEKQSDWVSMLDKDVDSDQRTQPWKPTVGDQAQDRHYLAYQPWDSAAKTDLFRDKMQGKDCKYCGGSGCQYCDATITFAG